MENREIRLANLRKLLRETKTAAALAYAANTSPAYISQILSKKTKGSIGNKLARRLELAANKPKGWLDLLHNDEEDTPNLSVKHIPFVEFERVLEWCLGKRWTPNKIISAIAEKDRLINENIFSTEMIGDAMVSFAEIGLCICPGDIAIINRDIPATCGDVVLVTIQDSVKVRQLAKDGDEPILKAFNPQYPIIPFTEQTKILGLITEIRRKIGANPKPLNMLTPPKEQLQPTT